MDNVNEQSKRKGRPAQRLYVPPAQRCRRNKIVKESKEIGEMLSTNSVDMSDSLQKRLESMKLSDTDSRSCMTNETPQINANKGKIDETDEMNRAMVNINRKSSRAIIKHSANYFPSDNVLQINTEPERIEKVPSVAKTKTDAQAANWEDLINEDYEGNDYSQHHDDNIDEEDDAEEAVHHHRKYKHNLSDLEHVIELYDFPASFRTQDLITLYNLVNSDSSYIKWCDETHALLVVGTAAQASRALEIKHDIVKSRPVTVASSIAIQTIEKCDFRPAMKRPETSMHTARRMITSALGTKSNISVETQKMEREALRKAKELKRMQKQNEQDAWEGHPRPSTA